MNLAIFKITVPAGQDSQLVQAFRSVTMGARSERGFIEGRLYRETDDPNTLCYIETWLGREDLEAQMRSNRFSLLLAIMETSAAQPTLVFYLDAEAHGLNYLKTVRSGEPSLSLIPDSSRTGEKTSS